MSGNVESFRYRNVERHIIGLVESGALNPGDRLPSLRRMSRTMNMSISTISQAYGELERKGMVQARPRSGYYVRGDFREMPLPSAPTPHLSANLVNRAELIRNVLQVVGNHDIVSLGMATPDPGLMPCKELYAHLRRAMSERALDLMDYEPITGNTELKRQIAFRSMEAGINVRPEEILITNGALEAMGIALRCLTRPGDAVLIPSPSYYCFLQMLEHLGLRAVEIPSRPEVGVLPKDVRNALDRLDIKACILSLNFNNPDGSLPEEDAKREIVELLARRGVPLLEDDVVGELFFEGDRRPSACKKYDPGNAVTYCGSFSKTLAPGFRVGWMIPAGYLGKAFDIKTVTNISTATPMQVAVAEYLKGGGFERHLRRMCEQVGNQAQAMRLQVQRHFPQGTRITRPRGGSTLWLELPGGLDSVEYFRRAKELGIGICPGPIFSTQDKFTNFVRLTYNEKWDARRAGAVATLGRLAHDMLDENGGRD